MASNGDETLNLTVKDQTGGEVKFKVKRHTPFQKIFQAYCNRKGLQLSDVKFIYDSDRLKAEETPQQRDMDDLDVIDAVLEM
eukprot:jgi/Astpho2/4514/Aster-00110